MDIRALLLVVVAGMGTLVATAQAPPVFTNHVEYDAWKQQFITPQDAPAHPIALPPATDVEDNSRGGSATCDCWVTPNASYTTINNANQWNAGGFGTADDGSYGPINLPFSFYLYGQTWSTAYINVNGNISFGSPYGTYNANGLPFSGTTLVAPFWADVDLRANVAGMNIVQYKVTPTALYVNWTNVGYFSMMTDKVNSFQVIITDGLDPAVPNGANVSFCYGDMQWTTGGASGGVNGFGGTPASVGANQGNGIDYIQFGRFDHEGTDYDGPFGSPDGVSWLDNKYFTFATLVTTGNVPPIVTGQSVCDSLTVCTDQPTFLSVDFLSPEPSQTTSATSYCTSLANYATVNSTTGTTATIMTQFTPTIADTGYHDVYFEGTDDGVPVLTSILHIVVHVLPTPQLTSTALDVCDDGAPFDMLALLGQNIPNDGEWTAPDTTVHTSIFTPGVDLNGGYTYVVDIGGSCSAMGVATITNVPHADAGGDTALAYCSWDYPDPLFQHIPGAPQNGGSWQSPTGVVFNGTLDPGTMFPGTYKYIITGNTPCLNDTALLQIAIPQAVDAGQDSSVVLCRDAAPFSLQTMLAGTPDATGTWADVNGATVPDAFDPATGLIGVYTYTVPAVLPCPDLSAVLTVNLDVLPIAGIDSSLVICANGGDTPLFPLLGGTPDVGGHWLSPIDSAVANGILDPSLEISGGYRYVAIGPGTCAHLSDTAIVDVHIDPLPVISFLADPDSGCAPLEVTFTNTTDPIYQGPGSVWDFGDGSDPVDTLNDITHLYTDPGWYHVKLKVTTPQGCTDQLIAPGKVLVDPQPVGTFTYTPDPPTAGNNNMVFTGTDPHAVEFFWTLPDFSQQAGQQIQYTLPDKIADDYTVCLSVRDRYGCADTLCDTIHVFVDNFWAPTAFTPDGNGVNDVFLPITTDMAPEDYHLRIFDRWGGLIFETTDPNKGWDGSGKGGGKAEPGVYVWRLDYRPLYTADKLDDYGHVTLLR